MRLLSSKTGVRVSAQSGEDSKLACWAYCGPCPRRVSMEAAKPFREGAGLQMGGRMFRLRSALLWLALSSLAGCAGGSSGATRADVSNVDVGMTQNQVLSILGQPQMREAYGPTEFLFYPGSSGSTVPVAIVDGKVTSIGRAAYEIVVQSKAQSASTASTPR